MYALLAYLLLRCIGVGHVMYHVQSLRCHFWRGKAYAGGVIVACLSLSNVV